MSVQLQQKTAVGYFVSSSVDDFVFIGGAMVTDNFGLPLEFRYTEPVRANRLQRVLYGDVLERFIHTDVILVNLLGNMEMKPSLLIVNDERFISCVDNNGAIGVWLGETRVPRLASIGTVQNIAPDEFLLQLSESGSPARVRVSLKYGDDEHRAEISAKLLEAAKTMEVTEPLRRIETAIRLIWEESPDNCLSPEVVDI
jgi:hypothetical protein